MREVFPLRSALVAAIALLVAACAPELHAPRSQPGSLERLAAENQAAKYTEACDREDAELQGEIVRALDTRKSEIETFDKNDSVDRGDIGVHEVGPTYFIEIDREPPTENKWVEYTYSWRGIYQDYLKIKDQPVNEGWMWLNVDARSLLLDDEFRLGGVGQVIYYDEVDDLALLQAEVKACYDKDDCYLPELSAGSMQLARRAYTYYAEYLYDYEVEPDLNRSAIEYWNRRLGWDYGRHEFRPTATITRGADGSLNVPLRTRDFAGSESFFEYAIGKYWSAGNVVVEWVSENSDGNFILNFYNEPGSRSYVDRYNQEMMLAEGASVKTVGHEFGHILGFRDRYFTIWNPEDCSYTIQYNRYDLMSSGSIVVDADWAELDRQYPRGVLN